MKKIAVFMALLAVAAALHAAGQKGGGGTQSAGADSNPYGVKPISDKHITLKIFAPKDQTITPYDDMEIFQKYNKGANVTIQWEQPNSELAAERFNIILASADLPDMFWNLSNAQNALINLKAAGAIIPLQKYMKDAPNFVNQIKSNPETESAIVEPDGNIWSLPLFDVLACNDPTTLRQDWLEKLNLPLPTTRDEWLAYWKGVRDNDVNGNGDPKDEIPLSATGNMGFRSWVSTFGMFDTFYVDVNDNRTVKYSNIEKKYRDFLAWGNMLWNENILDREFASITGDTFRKKNSQNLVGSYRGALNSALNAFMQTIPRNIPGYKLMATVPAKSDEGLQLHPGVNNLVRDNLVGAVVTVTSKYPAESVRYCDWFYEWKIPHGGAFMMIFGIEGLTFDFTADKKDFKYSDFVLNNPDGMAASVVMARYTTRMQHAGYSTNQGSIKWWHPATVESYSHIDPYYKSSLDWKIQSLPFTDEESRNIRAKMADISTYVDEMVNRFIMGREPLSGFDKYVATVKSMGIDDVLKIYNDAYKRYNAPRPKVF
jgi:putative aldouronate transport system substrate-binding protein